MSRWKARLPAYYRESRARRRRPSDAAEWFVPIPDGHGEVALIPMSGSHRSTILVPPVGLMVPETEPCGKGCTCRVVARMIARMDAIGGDKRDSMATVALRSARCRQEGRIIAAAARHQIDYPPWWWEIRGLIMAVRKRLEPIRKEEGQMIGYGARGLDPDSGGYRTIAVRALEDCR